MLRIGVDLGGTKTEAIVIDETGAEMMRERRATSRASYRDVVTSVRDLVQGLESKLGKKASVGVGLPGSISPRTGLIRNANLQLLNGNPFDRDLSEVLDRTVRVENDANCFAVSEASDGAGAGESVVFGVIAGTGCGGGVVINGRVQTGYNAIGGEWGHNGLPWMEPEEYPGPACYCGKKGCIETFISGTGFQDDYERHVGKRITGEEIAHLAEKGDAQAMAALNRYIDRMARSLAVVTNILDPDVIVLGGGMSNVLALYDEVPKLLSKHAFSDGIATPVRRAKHGDSSGVRGAAWLWTLEDIRMAA